MYSLAVASSFHFPVMESSSLQLLPVCNDMQYGTEAAHMAAECPLCNENNQEVSQV